jgi:hypothetical protein
VSTRTHADLQDLRTRARAADRDDDPILVMVDDPACEAHGDSAELVDVNDDGTFRVRLVALADDITVAGVEER